MRRRGTKSSAASTRSSRRSRMRKQNEGRPDADACFGLRNGVRSACWRPAGTGAAKLQGLRRSEEGLHEELCRANLFDRIHDVHEVVQKVARRTRLKTPRAPGPRR